jgi:hypothetical protein
MLKTPVCRSRDALQRSRYEGRASRRRAQDAHAGALTSLGWAKKVAPILDRCGWRRTHGIGVRSSASPPHDGRSHSRQACSRAGMTWEATSERCVSVSAARRETHATARTSDRWVSLEIEQAEIHGLGVGRWPRSRNSARDAVTLAPLPILPYAWSLRKRGRAASNIREQYPNNIEAKLRISTHLLLPARSVLFWGQCQPGIRRGAPARASPARAAQRRATSLAIRAFTLRGASSRIEIVRSIMWAACRAVQDSMVVD